MASIDADYKLIYIDNAESLNSDAQNALRRIMEKYSATCRFILSTTKPSKLIAPLRSRVLQIFFTYVPDSVLKTHLEKIGCAEKLELSEDALDAILYGDFSRGRQLIDEMIVEKGLSGTEILERLCEALVNSGETDEDVARLIVKISETDACLKDAANYRIQLEKLISNFS